MAATSSPGIPAIYLGGNHHILEYKLFRYLGWGGDPALLEFKLSRYLGLAATNYPGIHAILILGLGGDQQILEYKLSKYLG